jgi:hypothetical protein
MPTYIWTNHARKRLADRKIAKNFIDQTLAHPDKIIKEKTHTELQKNITGRTFAAIIKTSQRGEKLIISCWANPAYPGTNDARKHARYLQMRKASFWKKIWLTILNQLGL